METIYLAGGCLWGVQAYLKRVPGVITTEAGRANGTSQSLNSNYDGYAECVKTTFDPSVLPFKQLMVEFFLIIDPYSINKQGIDEGPKYRTGVYSKDDNHLKQAMQYINDRADKDQIVVEVLPLSNYIPSAEEHQDHLDKFPDDYCHIPQSLMERHMNH